MDIENLNISNSPPYDSNYYLLQDVNKYTKTVVVKLRHCNARPKYGRRYENNINKIKVNIQTLIIGTCQPRMEHAERILTVKTIHPLHACMIATIYVARRLY